MTVVERLGRHSTLRPAREHRRIRWTVSTLALVAVCLSNVALSPRLAGASTISADRARAAVLYRQIQTTDDRVQALGQKYDEAHVKLQRFTNQIKNTKNVVAQIERNVAKGIVQLRQDAIFAYVTDGSQSGNNPLFSPNASKVGATSVYNQLAEGNVGTTIASLKNYKIELTQEKSILANEDLQAADATRAAAGAFHDARVLQASLDNSLAQVKGQISTFIDQEEAAANAASANQLNSAQALNGVPIPPPDSKADIAIRAAITFLGVPYVWGGASRSGVDCSGLIMLAYDAAGIYFPHYSGAMYEDTVRVPLWDIQPGDLLFYGYDGDQHVAMYVGHGMMIEAEMTGTVVHIVPVRLGYGFWGLGRPRG